MRRVGLGIIGAGDRGRMHLMNALHLEDVDLVGVADASKSAINSVKRLGIRNCHLDYAKLLHNPKIDALVVSLPNFLHLESVERAGEAGKHVFLEKPLARNVNEGERIVSSVQRNGIKLMMGYDLRFKPRLRKLREMVREGLLGAVELAEATIVGSGPFSERRGIYGPRPVPEWWFSKELVGGGALLDVGCHMIDLFTWYFGRVQEARSCLGYCMRMDIEDTASCLLRFEGGPIGIVNAGWFSKARTTMLNVCGTASIVSEQISPSGITGIISRDLRKKLGYLKADADFLELKYFVECIRNDLDPVPSVKDGLVNLQIIDSAYRNPIMHTS